MMNPIKNSLFLSCLLVSLTPAHAQQVTHSQMPSQVFAESDIDDTDIDLTSPPCPVKYAHPTVAVSLSHYRIPAPKNLEARKHYLQAQNLQNIGFAYLVYGRYAKAISRLQEACVLWPDSADTYRWLAETYEAEGQTQQAIANYRLLFDGWPGRVRSSMLEQSDDKAPADKPRDYDQVSSAETDPTLLMQFSLLLQQTNQDVEARKVYDRGMQALMTKFADTGKPLPPLLAKQLIDSKSLEAATRTALAIDEASYQNYKDAVINIDRALQIQPNFAVAQFAREKILKAHS